MRAIDLCDILERKYKKGEFQCNMDSCGNKPCDLCTVEKFEKEIRADERAKTIEEMSQIIRRIEADTSRCLFDCPKADEPITCTICVLEKAIEQMKGE